MMLRVHKVAALHGKVHSRLPSQCATVKNNTMYAAILNIAHRKVPTSVRLAAQHTQLRAALTKAPEATENFSNAR